MSLHDMGNIAVGVAGILWGIEMIPQIIKTMKTKIVEGHSMSFYVMCYIAYLLYIFGNSLLENWIIIWSHIPSYICTTIMVCLLIKYRKKRDKKLSKEDLDSIKSAQQRYLNMSIKEKNEYIKTLINDLYGGSLIVLPNPNKEN